MHLNFHIGCSCSLPNLLLGCLLLPYLYAVNLCNGSSVDRRGTSIFLTCKPVTMLRHFDRYEARITFQVASQLSQHHLLNESVFLADSDATLPYVQFNFYGAFVCCSTDLSYSSTALLIIIHLHYVLIK